MHRLYNGYYPGLPFRKTTAGDPGSNAPFTKLHQTAGVKPTTAKRSCSKVPAGA